MRFSANIAPVSLEDFRFEELIDIDLSQPIQHEEYEDLYELYSNTFCPMGHKIGGYPFFTQYDPRSRNNPTSQYNVLLFQADMDDEIDLMFGDSGVANFFIREEDLRKRDFTDVLYYGDCL